MVRESHLLERDEQLNALQHWFEEAVAGNSHLVFVGGEAGVGKSTLVQAFIQTLSGRARVLRGVCDTLSTPRPLGPLHDFALSIGGVFAGFMTGGAPRERAFHAALTMLREGPEPIVAVIEDAHWADEATIDLLRFLSRRLESVRSLIVVTYRDDEVGAGHPLRRLLGDLATQPRIKRLALAPLSADGIAMLVRESAGHRDIDAASLHRLTAGNPFFATEVLAGSTPAGSIPETVRDAVLARASRLPSPARTALDAAATIGTLIPIDLLLAVCDASIEDLEAGIAGGMLMPAEDHALAFRHDLARSAIYEAISTPVRRVLHQRVLDVLRSMPGTGADAAVLAHHAEMAGDRTAVLEFALAAAKQAVAMQTHREAAAQYARALKCFNAEPPPARAELLEASAYEHYLTGRVDEAIDIELDAIMIWEDLADRLRLGDAHRRLARFYWLAGRNTEARQSVEQAIALLEGFPPGSELASAMGTRAQLDMLSSETESAIAWGERAIALASRIGDIETLVHALNSVGAARLHVEDRRGWEELERSLARSLDANLEEHVARAYMNLAWNAVHSRELERATGYLDAGISYTTDRDLDSSRLYMLSCRSQVRLLIGEWAKALVDAEEVLRSSQSVAVGRITALTVKGLILARRKGQGAREALAEALSIAEATGEVQRVRPVRIALAELAWLNGDAEGAIAEANAVLDLTISHGSPWGIGDVLVWLERTGSLEPVALPVNIDTLAEPYRMALRGDWPASAAFWSARNCRYDAALVMLDGDEAAIRAAHAIFCDLGADAAASLAARRLRNLGARKIPRGPRPETRSNTANLTNRELEILPLLASGQRNAEIADRLFLSSKTVEHHVGKILRKLGVRTRGEVMAAAKRLEMKLHEPQNRAAD